MEQLAAKLDTDDLDGVRSSIDDFERSYSRAKRKFDELKSAGSEKWEPLKSDIWIAWNDLENAYLSFQESVLKRSMGERETMPKRTREEKSTKKIAQVAKRVPYPGKRICTDAEILYPNFDKQSAPDEKPRLRRKK